MVWQQTISFNFQLPDKAGAILKTGIERFDGAFLFPQNEMNGAHYAKDSDVFQRRAINKPGFKFRLCDCRQTFAAEALES